jgi:hypothetical protein
MRIRSTTLHIASHLINGDPAKGQTLLCEITSWGALIGLLDPWRLAPPNWSQPIKSSAENTAAHLRRAADVRGLSRVYTLTI